METALPPVAGKNQPSPAPTNGAAAADAREGLKPAEIRKSFVEHVEYTRGTSFDMATAYDKYMALAHSVRDRLAKAWVNTQRRYNAANAKRAYYLSAEYLLGRALGNNLINLGLYEPAHEALKDVGVDLSALLEMEPDAG
jgi:glycogen phosphorylase